MASAVVGFVVGAVIVGVVSLLPVGKRTHVDDHVPD
jgi:hypothetical protein